MMGEVIELNFGGDGRVLDRKDYVSTTRGVTYAYAFKNHIKTAETATRHELREQAANVLANLDIAKTTRYNLDEIKAFGVVLKQCIGAFEPPANKDDEKIIDNAAMVILEELQQAGNHARASTAQLYEVSELQAQYEEGRK